jgi:LacI family transcriptional regulator, repressor for deo operon, udp, cdd, tsx, nupC, and nupG
MAERGPSGKDASIPLRGGGRRRVTLDDVAELAGVSRMTASRALNNARYVSAEAHDRVWEASKALGFVAHHGARSLATNRAGSIALIAPMTDDRFFSDPNIAPVIAGANAALSERGSQLVVLIAGNEAQTARIETYVRARHVDGAIVVSPELVGPMVEQLLLGELPLAGMSAAGQKTEFDSVVIDSASAVGEMIRFLKSSGSSRIAMVAGPDDGAVTAQQVAAYEQALDGQTPLLEHGDYSERSGRAAASRLLDRVPDLDAIFAANDVMAIGVLRALLERGISVPERVRVAGFDDSSAALSAVPTLTTVAVPFEEMGRTMAEMVLERVGSPALAPRHVVLPTSIVRRQSA